MSRQTIPQPRLRLYIFIDITNWFLSVSGTRYARRFLRKIDETFHVLLCKKIRFYHKGLIVLYTLTWRMPSSRVWRRVDVVDCTVLQLPAHTLVLRSRIFLPWRWRRYDPPKRRFNRPHLHGATLQKTAFFLIVLSFKKFLTFCAMRNFITLFAIDRQYALF
jgi:hypothetical protein